MKPIALRTSPNIKQVQANQPLVVTTNQSSNCEIFQLLTIIADICEESASLKNLALVNSDGFTRVNDGSGKAIIESVNLNATLPSNTYEIGSRKVNEFFRSHKRNTRSQMMEFLLSGDDTERKFEISFSTCVCLVEYLFLYPLTHSP